MQARRRLTSHPDLPLAEAPSAGSLQWNGQRIPICEGDTVASALYAAGVTTFSRSFKYHRRRGLYDGHGYGPEVLLTIGGEPNLSADRITARDGMIVASQNAWPSVDFDLMGVNDTLVPLLPNGFYYKMFHKPKWAWPLFEKGIRKVAGLGTIDTGDDGHYNRYEKRSLSEKRYSGHQWICLLK